MYSVTDAFGSVVEKRDRRDDRADHPAAEPRLGPEAGDLGPVRSPAGLGSLGEAGSEARRNHRGRHARRCPDLVVELGEGTR